MEESWTVGNINIVVEGDTMPSPVAAPGVKAPTKPSPKSPADSNAYAERNVGRPN